MAVSGDSDVGERLARVETSITGIQDSVKEIQRCLSVLVRVEERQEAHVCRLEDIADGMQSLELRIEVLERNMERLNMLWKLVIGVGALLGTAVGTKLISLILTP